MSSYLTARPSISKRLRRFYMRSRKRIVRYTILTANLALLAGVVFFVVKSPTAQSTSHQSVVTGNTASNALTGPLDQVSSADIAVHVALSVGLPERADVINHADSIALTEAATPADTTVVAKPQVISTKVATKSDIQNYTVVAGDNISSIATKFGVSSDSIRWSNNVTGNTVAAGKVLLIPPTGMNGIVYKVKSGDTAESLARKFGANKDVITSFNDAEVSGLKEGDQIFIPDGTIQQVVAAQTTYNYYAGFAWGGNSPVYGYNGYGYGSCTWYVATRVSMPANWGNANTWDSGARASGWIVTHTPIVGAIAQTDGMSYLGHVAYVEAVSEDGTMIKYSDMNGLAGYNRVGYSDWVPVSRYTWYIYH